MPGFLLHVGARGHLPARRARSRSSPATPASRSAGSRRRRCSPTRARSRAARSRFPSGRHQAAAVRHRAAGSCRPTRVRIGGQPACCRPAPASAERRADPAGAADGRQRADSREGHMRRAQSEAPDARRFPVQLRRPRPHRATGRRGAHPRPDRAGAVHRARRARQPARRSAAACCSSSSRPTATSWRPRRSSSVQGALQQLARRADRGRVPSRSRATMRAARRPSSTSSAARSSAGSPSSSAGVPA